MDINVTQVMFHLVIFWLPYLFFRGYYRHVLHPDYRWHQKGNISYQYRRIFAIMGAIITGILIELIFVYGLVKFHL